MPTKPTTPASTTDQRSNIYFGWRIVLALFLSTLALYGVSIYSFILLTSPMADEYGWSSAQMGSLVSAMWLSAPLALFFAPVIRAFGAWKLLFTGFIIQAVAMCTLSFITEIWQVYCLRVFMGIGKVAMVVSVPVIISLWFQSRFATAIAVVWAGGSAGGFLMSPLTQYLISSYGWRSASFAIAGGIGLVIVLVYMLGHSRQSADPDAGRERPLEDSEDHAVADLGAVLKSIHWPAAILMFIAVVGLALTTVSILSQEPTLLVQAGISSANAALLLSVISAASMVGAASIGWMLDRFPAAGPALLVSGLMYTGLLLFNHLLQHPSLVAGVLTGCSIGYAIGAGEVLWMNLTKHQFGASVFATTYGGWFLAMQIGYGAGGGLSGWAMDYFNATELLLLLAVLYLPAAVFSLWRPQLPQSRAASAG